MPCQRLAGGVFSDGRGPKGRKAVAGLLLEQGELGRRGVPVPPQRYWTVVEVVINLPRRVVHRLSISPVFGPLLCPKQLHLQSEPRVASALEIGLRAEPFGDLLSQVVL